MLVESGREVFVDMPSDPTGHLGEWGWARAAGVQMQCHYCWV